MKKKLDILAQQFDVFTVLGDAKTIETLNKIDVKSFDFLIATTTSDDTNILAASFAKILGCKRVIARVREPEHMNQLDFLREHYNIDMLINPDLLITSESIDIWLRNTLLAMVFLLREVSHLLNLMLIRNLSLSVNR